MRFWIAVICFFLGVFLVTKGVARGQGDSHKVRMGRLTRSGAALMLGLTLAACTSSGQGADPITPSPTAPSQTPTESPGGLPWPAPPTSALPPERATKILAEMQRWVDKEFMPGVTAAVVSPHGVWTAAVGVDGQGAKLEPASGMSLGQVTQTFVAAEALLLAEQGKLDLDVPASTYVPVPQLANGATTRQLLGHRAGIPDPGQEPYAAVFTAPDAHWSTEQFLTPVPTPSAPPGEKFYEDTTNYVLAGLVVEKVSGRSSATAIDADLWTPLGLDRLAYQDEQALPEPIAAPGEDEGLPKGQTGRPYLPFRSIASAIAASHGAAGDAAAVARWGYALYGGQVLTPDSVAQLTDFGQDVGPGYGLATIDFTQPYWFKWHIEGHGMRGSLVGYRSVLAVYPEHHPERRDPHPLRGRRPPLRALHRQRGTPPRMSVQVSSGGRARHKVSRSARPSSTRAERHTSPDPRIGRATAR